MTDLNEEQKTAERAKMMAKVQIKHNNRKKPNK